jgi:hypothetical protein
VEASSAVKASSAMKPPATVTAPSPVSDGVGHRSEQSGNDNTGQEKLQFHNSQSSLFI